MLQIGVVSRTGIAIPQSKNKKQKKYFASETFSTGVSCGSFEFHAPRCNPIRPADGGANSARSFLDRIRRGIGIVLAIFGTASVFGAASFSSLPYSDPFPPAAPAGSTVFSQPAGSIVLNENLNGVGLPVTRSSPAGWQSGMGAISIEFWLKQKAPQGTNPQQDNPDGTIIHGPGYYVEANWLFGNPVNGYGPGSILCYLSQAKGSAYLAARPIAIPLLPSDQQWHQYVITYDLRTVRLYRDGDLIEQKWLDNNTDRLGPFEDDSGNLPSGQIRIGDKVSGGRSFGNGWLEAVRVSSVALSPWQVRRNFENARSYGQTIHVAPGGNGSGTLSSPASLASALNQVGATRRIILQPGTYNGAEFQVNRAALSAREHCLITGADGGAPAIISGGSPSLSGANYVYLRNLTFSSDSGPALSVNNSLAVTVDSCRFSGSQDGLVANGSSRITVQNSVFNAGNIGLRLAGSPNNILRHNTIVNGNVGLQLDSGSSHSSVLNNLMSGQSSASMVVNNGAQQWYRGNGNLYHPASGTAVILNGTSYSMAQVRNKSLAQAWYNADTVDVQDNNQRRRGYAAEAQSMAFAPSFVNAGAGDFRLAATLGNALDAGAERTFQRAVISPSFDAQGAMRPRGNQVDVGAYESVGPAYASFNLDGDYTTSAGVYKGDGTLVRTLFSGRRMAGGANVVFWNGLNDNGEAVPSDSYTIKMIAHNVNYFWENVVGNSSVPNSGSSVHNGFEPIKAMTFAGTSAFYTSGYNEGHHELNRFETSNPNRLTKIFGPKTTITSDSITDIASDGNKLFGINSGQVFVYGVSSTSQTGTFGAGNGSGGHVEVQRNGNLLFVARRNQNLIYILDKNSGAQTGTIQVNQPGDLSVTASGDLWVVTGNSVVRYAVNSGGGSAVQTIGGFQNPIAVACSPVDGTVLVADAGTWQVKAFNSSGSPIWTHGQAGGFANGPRVTPDKFYWAFIDQGQTHITTFLQFQPDGTWWVGDTFINRALHFNMQRQLLHEINYQPHTYMASADPNNGSRVFNRFTEYHVDYSKSPQQGWTITNFWGFGLPAYAYGFDDGICSAITLNNGRTYAMIYDGGAGGTRVVVELTANGLRETSSRGHGNYSRIAKDGSIFGQTGSSSQTYQRRPLSGFTANGDPTWGTAVSIASATVGSGFLSSDPQSEKYPLTTSSGTVVVFDPGRHRTGYHLGGIKPGGNQWLWRAMPTVGGHDGRGHADSWVEYGGNHHMVAGRNIFAGFHGEFYQDAGQSGQFMHYYDNGLFVGQFGQPLVFGVVVNAPGGSGNCFAPAVVEVGTNVFLYHNDEPGRGSHRWRAAGLSAIRELSAGITVGQAPAGTTNVPTSGILTNTIGDGGLGAGTPGGGGNPTVTIAATAHATEGVVSGAFTITRTGSTTAPLPVNYTVAGTASPATDYQGLGPPVTIPAGASSAVIAIIPADDSVSESSENVILTLGSSANYDVGTPSSATVTITDNDGSGGGTNTTPVVSLRRNGPAMIMSWNSVPGTVYRMHYKNKLSDTGWIPLGSPVTATGATASYTDVPPTNGMRLYKVKVE
jgi:hypothetical protein